MESSANMPKAELLERDELLPGLESTFDRARRGEGALVLVAGEAGVGKTALVDALTLTSLSGDRKSVENLIAA